MTQESPAEPVKVLVKAITDIGAYVAASVAYLVAISGTAQTPYPRTTSLLTVIITSVLVVSWRWSQIRRRRANGVASGLLIIGDSQAPRPLPFSERLLDPVQRYSRESYVLPLGRRRFEASLLLTLIFFTAGWSGTNFGKVFAEWTNDPLLTCSPFNATDLLYILIADLSQTQNQPQLLISDKIYEALVSRQQEGQFDVCRLAKSFQLSTVALETARNYRADIVIWGRSDVIYEIHLEVPAFDDPDRKLSDLSMQEAVSVAFQFQEPTRIAYVTEFALSEVLLLNGETLAAQTRLTELIAQAKRNSMETSYPKDLARVYFLRGLSYDPGFSDDSDEQKALDDYQTALTLNPDLYDAWLNHGLILKDLGRAEEALADFNYLIENNTPLKASAYVDRSDLQSSPEATLRDLDAVIELDPAEGYFFRGNERLNQQDYQGAIADFKQAVRYDSEGYYNYHLLGQAQLYAGEDDAAKQTYAQIIPYLDEETRQQVISELREDAEVSPEIKPAVEEIIQTLHAARLQ